MPGVLGVRTLDDLIIQQYVLNDVLLGHLQAPTGGCKVFLADSLQQATGK